MYFLLFPLYSIFVEYDILTYTLKYYILNCRLNLLLSTYHVTFVILHHFSVPPFTSLNRESDI